MTRPSTREVRRTIPLAVQLAVALRMLGYRREDIEFDHDPALSLRKWDDKAQDFDPPQLDADFIVIRTKAEHRTKTTGRKGERRVTSYGSDQHAVAKVKRLEQSRLRLMTPAEMERFEPRRKKRKIPARANQWPKGRKLQSRNNLRRRPR